MKKVKLKKSKLKKLVKSKKVKLKKLKLKKLVGPFVIGDHRKASQVFAAQSMEGCRSQAGFSNTPYRQWHSVAGIADAIKKQWILEDGLLKNHKIVLTQNLHGFWLAVMFEGKKETYLFTETTLDTAKAAGEKTLNHLMRGYTPAPETKTRKTVQKKAKKKIKKKKNASEMAQARKWL